MHWNRYFSMLTTVNQIILFQDCQFFVVWKTHLRVMLTKIIPRFFFTWTDCIPIIHYLNLIRSSLLGDPFLYSSFLCFLLISSFLLLYCGNFYSHIFCVKLICVFVWNINIKYYYFFWRNTKKLLCVWYVTVVLSSVPSQKKDFYGI